jgi:hypothetical protein
MRHVAIFLSGSDGSKPSMEQPHGALRRIALSTGVCLVLGAWLGPVQSAVTVTGDINAFPVAIPIGPGNVSSPATGIQIGLPGAGSLTADGGSQVNLRAIYFGAGGAGHGTGLFTDPGTRVTLTGDNGQRLIVGDWGAGTLTVAGGAVLDTLTNQAACHVPFHFCDVFVGGSAGSTGTLNLTGAGTQAILGQAFFVAHPGLAVQIVDGYTYGVPGGTVRGAVNITDGALLRTGWSHVATAHWSTSATGRERNIAEVTVSGSGARWEVVGGTTVDHVTGALLTNSAHILTANDPNAWASMSILDGGLLEIQGIAGMDNGINLTRGGGRTDLLVSGPGSRINFSGDSGYLNIGRENGTAFVQVLGGGKVAGAYYTSVGRDGSYGELLLDGMGTSYSATGTQSPAVDGVASNALVEIGRNGTGIVTLQNGARMDILAGGTYTQAPIMNLGRGLSSSGTLNLSSGSFVELSSVSLVAGGGAGEAFNPVVSIGREGSGRLNISGGAKLLVNGNAISTAAAARTTAVNIGGFSDTAAGGSAVAVINGVGSELRVTGSDALVIVGRGPGSVGQLTISNQGKLAATILHVGRAGVGVLSMDNAQVELSGQFIGGTQAGANFSVGTDGGVGSATLTNGSRMVVTNSGPASVNVGGTSNNPLGDGTLALRGGSRIDVIAGPGQANMTVGRDGSGLARLREGSAIDLGDGSLYVGRFAGADGTMVLTDSSAVTASYVGIGRNKIGNGGTGTLVVLSGSTLDAEIIEIGQNGFLGGTGTIIGAVTNYGIVAPGNSPGTLIIDGSFVNGAGGRIFLEVEANGSGGFNTDQLIFSQGSTIDLTGVEIRFQFLGATDPNAFKASGAFDIDSFLKKEAAGGIIVPLESSAYTGVLFAAQSDAYVFQNFAFNLDTGASFVAAPVPEPHEWALMMTGLLLVRLTAKRRKHVRAPLRML